MSKAPRRSQANPRQFLEQVLESSQRGFSYDMIELEMSIEDQGKPLGNSKIEDITRLIQLYMIGVESLESKEDPRFKYFTRKLQSLLLRKTVADQLRQAANITSSNEYMMNPPNQKRQQHEMQMYYFRDQSEKSKVQQLLRSVQQKLKSYEGIVQNQLSKQKDNIRDRIKQRKMRSETSSLRRYSGESEEPAAKPKGEDRRFQYFQSSPQKKPQKQDQPGSAVAPRSKNLVTTGLRHDQI